VAIAHGGGELLRPATLEVLGAGRWTVHCPAVAPLGVAELGHVDIELPITHENRTLRLDLRLVGSAREVIATNVVEVAIVAPRAAASGVARPRAWSPEPELLARLDALGYDLADQLASATVAVASRADASIAEFVRQGGSFVLMPHEGATLTPFFPHWQNVKVAARDGTPWRGDWASTFAWLRRRGPFAGIPGGSLLDDAFERVLPEHVISGCNLLDFHSRVHAGLVVGWIHRPAALIAERRYGKGQVVVSTFRLCRDEPGFDPIATALLDGLIHLAGSAVQGSKLQAA
jgi:hypothetical protein